MNPVIGFIGLGHMGAAMAHRLLDAGFAMVVNDLDPLACRPFVERGARAVAQARELAALAEVVLLCLPSLDATLAVADELVAGLSPAASDAPATSRVSTLRVLVETSTVGPLGVRELARRLAQRGVDVLDAPISGGPSGARAGTLAMMHAGSDQAVALALPAMRAIAGRLIPVGAEPGLAQVCKLVNNAISAAGMIAACQATVVGVKSGLEAGAMLEAINAGSGRNAGTLDKFPGAILQGRFDHGGHMGLMLKDLSLFIEQSQALGVPATLAQAAYDEWCRAVQRTGANADYSMVIRHLEIDAGVQVRAVASTPQPTQTAQHQERPT